MREIRSHLAQKWEESLNLGLTGKESLEGVKRVRLFNCIRIPATFIILANAVGNFIIGADAAGYIDLFVGFIGLLSIFGPFKHRYNRTRYVAYLSFAFLVIAKKLIYGDSIFTHLHLFSMIAGLTMFFEDDHPAAKWGPYLTTAVVLLTISFGEMLVTPRAFPIPPLWSFVLDFTVCGIFITLSFQFLKRENRIALDHMSRNHAALNRMNLELSHAKKSLEEQAQKIVHQSKMTAIGEMGAGLAHEINNPLTITMGNIQLIMAELERAGHSKERIQSFSATALEHCKRIQTIVKALKHYSIDWEDSTPEDCDIQDILRDTTALMANRFREAGTDLLVSIGMDPIIICARPAHISQAILALLFNSFEAIKDMDDKWINVAVETSNESVSIRVIDCGPGIPEPHRSKLMQPFFTTKEVGQGKGLGLSTARAIIHQHSGSLTYDPECANTCFVIKLPLKSGQNSLAAG